MKLKEFARRTLPIFSLLSFAFFLGLYVRSADHMVDLGYRTAVPKTEWAIAFFHSWREVEYLGDNSVWSVGAPSNGFMALSIFHDDYQLWVDQYPGIGLMCGGCMGPPVSLQIAQLESFSHFRMGGTYLLLVPQWLPIGVSGTIAFWLWFHPVKSIRKFRRAAKGLCLNCGYDCRATRHQCPECGMRPQSPSRRFRFAALFGPRTAHLFLAQAIVLIMGWPTICGTACRVIFPLRAPDWLKVVVADTWARSEHHSEPNNMRTLCPRSSLKINVRGIYIRLPTKDTWYFLYLRGTTKYITTRENIASNSDHIFDGPEMTGNMGRIGHSVDASWW